MSEHQLAPSLCPTCQESQGGGEGRKIDLKGGEGHQYNRAFNPAQIKAHQSLPFLPFLPQGVQNQQRAGKVLLEEERECSAVQAGCFTHTHPHQSSHRPNSCTPSNHRATQTDHPWHGPAQRGVPAAPSPVQPGADFQGEEERLEGS